MYNRTIQASAGRRRPRRPETPGFYPKCLLTKYEDHEQRRPRRVLRNNGPKVASNIKSPTSVTNIYTLINLRTESTTSNVV